MVKNQVGPFDDQMKMTGQQLEEANLQKKTRK